MEEVKLSMETEFEIANFNRIVDGMTSVEDLRTACKDVHRSMVVRQKIFQTMLHQAYFGDNPYVTNQRPETEERGS